MEFYDAELFQSLKTEAKRIFTGPVIWVIIIGIGILGYLGAMVWKESPEILQKLPATVLRLVTGEPVNVEIEPEVPEIILIEEKNYVEMAEQGEGITHLARKALKGYLTEESQSFEVTSEHKIYIEDYIVKKTGSGWLSLGENLEISGDLIKEAIEKAETLSLEDLANLTQYSQLVPSLNY